MAKKTKERFNIQDMITEKLIAGLEKGKIPWNRPWNLTSSKKGDSNFVPVNHNSGRIYTGINFMLMPAGEYITFKKIKEAGFSLMKGSKSEIVVFWNPVEVEIDEVIGGKKTGKKVTVKRFFLKYYRVFNIENVYLDKECTDPVNPKWQDYAPKDAKLNDITLSEKEEQMNAALTTYISKYNIQYQETNENSAYYSPSFDSITLPHKDVFKSSIEYLETKAHEVVHSTGHKSRLDRLESARFGSVSYSKEELVAEIGAIMLGTKYVGLENLTLDNSQAYINGWIKYLKDHKREIISALSKAKKAAEMVIGGQLQEQEAKAVVKNMKAPESTKAANKGKDFVAYSASHLAWNFCVEKINELREAKKACDIYSISYENGKKFAKIKLYS